MATSVNVAGACRVQIATPSYLSGALQELGYTRNGADVTIESFFYDVPGDANGGDDGPPIEVQYLGEIARIRVELTTYDNTIADLCRARLDGAIAGTPPGTGSLMFSASNTMRVLLNAANDPRNFPRCFPRAPIEINRGTKFSTLVCEFEAHANASGLLYNAVTS